MGLVEERDGILIVEGPGALIQGSFMLVSLVLSVLSVVVPPMLGKVGWSDVPPALLCVGLFLFTLVAFESSYRFDPRRREIVRQIKILRLWSWTRKVADFTDIRSYYLSLPETYKQRPAMLEVLLPNGRILAIRLGNDNIQQVHEAVQRLLSRYQIGPGSQPNSRTIWDAPDENTGCLVSFFGCLSPFALVLMLGLVECFLPRVSLGVPPPALCLLYSLIFLGPFCSSGWRAVPAENLLQRYFSFGPWTFRKTSTLDGCQPEIQRLPEPEPRPFALVLKPGVRLDQFASEAQAEEGLAEFRRLLP